jgi:hypothetical protein
MRALRILGRVLRFGGIAVLVVATLAMAGTGPLAPGGAQAQSTDERLQIAPADGGPWGRGLDGIWSIDSLLPGESVTGAVLLRVVNTEPGDAGALFVSASLGTGATSALGEALEVTELGIGGADALWRFRFTCGVDRVTLAVLAECIVALPPPDNDGSLFVLTLSLDESAGNVLQGTSQPVFQLLFTIAGEDSVDQEPGPTETPIPTETPTGTPGGGETPVVTPTPTPIDDVAGERTEVPETPGAGTPGSGGQFPRPPAAGTGTVRDEHRAFQWLAVAGLAMLGAGGALWFVTGSRRRQ